MSHANAVMCRCIWLSFLSKFLVIGQFSDFYLTKILNSYKFHGNESLGRGEKLH